MPRYEAGDIVTFHFVLEKDPKFGTKSIRAFSDNKDLVKMYMEFHNCPRFTLKTMTMSIEKMKDITNANVHDEIHIENIYIKNPNAKKGENKLQMVQIPMTGAESVTLAADVTEFLSSAIDYAYMNSSIPYLKGKWQDVLKGIFLQDVIKKVTSPTTTNRLGWLDMDHLMVMLRGPLAGTFGK